jgi:3-hydroxyisobutyrate dehydrogenase-like beta-hydroxyacid dehydrogenase
MTVAAFERVGVIGLGQIGGAIAGRLAAAGSRPVIYDKDPGAVSACDGAADVAANPAGVAKAADLVLVAVLNGDQAEDVLFGSGGIQEAASGRTLAVVLSTMSSRKFTELHATAAARGLAVIDCSVTGGGQAAGLGKLVCLAGGSPTQLDRLTASSTSWASAVHRMGSVGCGLKAKLARNMITYTIMAAVYDAMRLAEATGLDVQELADAIRESDALTGGVAGRLLAAQGLARAHGQAHDRSARGLRMALKDLTAAEELQRTVRRPTAFTETVAARMGEIYGRPDLPHDDLHAVVGPPEDPSAGGAP